jgi:hypothetical protein
MDGPSVDPPSAAASVGTGASAPASAIVASGVASVEPSPMGVAASVDASAPPSALLPGMHTPTSPEVELHTRDDGHPFPPEPRQPGTQRALAESQTRPEVAVPQSESIAQPHEPPATQRAPARSTRHALSLAMVHSTHVLFDPQTNGAAQSWSTRHWTQVSTFSMVSHRGVGAAQSASLVQPAGVAQCPRPPKTPAQV